MSKLEPVLAAGRPSAQHTRAAMADAPTMKRVNCQLSVEQHMKLKLHAVRHGKTITELLSEYITQLPE